MYGNRHCAAVESPPSNGRALPRAFELSALVPPDGHALYSLDGAVSGPPVMPAANRARVELLSLVAAFECQDKAWFQKQLIWSTAAEYDDQQQLMLYCLLSPRKAAALYQQATCHFLAVPSLGVRLKGTAGRAKESRYPLWAFYVPDTPLTRVRLQAWYQRHPAARGSAKLH